MKRVWHIIAAGGTGSRFGADCPKQFCLLEGRPILMHTIEALHRATPEANIVIAIHSQWRDRWLEMCHDMEFESPAVVIGGKSRFESVANALDAVAGDAEIITVHDAARPAVSTDVVRSAIEAVESGAPGAVPAIDSTDSLRILGDDGIWRSIDRSRIRAVQTPQVFQASLLRRAYSKAIASGNSGRFTDDASVVEAAGFGPLELTRGDSENIKITHATDIETVANIIRHRKS